MLIPIAVTALIASAAVLLFLTVCAFITRPHFERSCSRAQLRKQGVK